MKAFIRLFALVLAMLAAPAGALPTTARGFVGAAPWKSLDFPTPAFNINGYAVVLRGANV